VVVIKEKIRRKMNPTEKIKEIEKEIEELEKHGESCCPECDLCMVCETLLKPAEAKLQIYKEWEQKEKEILEDEIKFLDELSDTDGYGTVIDKVCKKSEELKTKIKNHSQETKSVDKGDIANRKDTLAYKKSDLSLDINI
jgi:hypothetical protein